MDGLSIISKGRLATKDITVLKFPLSLSLTRTKPKLTLVAKKKVAIVCVRKGA